MNPTAIERYAKWGGAELSGKNLLNCHGPGCGEMIQKVIDWFRKDQVNNIIWIS